MNAVEKIATAVRGMWGGNTSWCHNIAALHMVATKECEPSPERDALILHIEQMFAQVKQMCDSYDKLRSLTGALEKGNCDKPRFYVDADAGKTCKDFCPVLTDTLIKDST